MFAAISSRKRPLWHFLWGIHPGPVRNDIGGVLSLADRSISTKSRIVRSPVHTVRNDCLPTPVTVCDFPAGGHRPR